MMNKNFEQDFISNQNGTDKVNVISENMTKIWVSFDFTKFLMSHIGKKGALDHIYFRNDLWVRLLEQVH